MKTHRRATVTSALVLAVVFTSGTLVGRAWDDQEARAAITGVEEDGTGQDTGTDGDRRARRTPMYERVGISDAQRVAIDSIVVHYRSGVRTLQREAREEYETGYRVLVDSAREAIKAVMTDEQRIEYDALLRSSDERRRERKSERDDDEGREE